MSRFRVLERIGSGGMGTVYRAFDERLQRHVAVKEIVGADADRVLREAHAAARLNHPGIVTLYELGAERGHAILVSELVEGGTLADLARTGGLSDREVAELGADVCDALAHAHEHGVVHRDVKPQNVVVRADDGVGRRAKLMDFGIAALSDAPTLTATGEVVGTLAYMSPEQANGARAGEAADLYSLALTLYECWAGGNPVLRETPAATARAIGAPMPSLGSARPDLPPRLVEWIDACLDREPDLRPDLASLHAALDDAQPRLDPDRPVPSAVAAGDEAGSPVARVVVFAAIAAAASGTAYLAGPAGQVPVALLLALVAGLAAALLDLGRATAAPALVCALGGAAVAGAETALAAGTVALVAITFAPMLRLAHVAVALLVAVLWAAGLEGLLRAIGSDGVAGPPQLVAALAVIAVIMEFRSRERPPRTAAQAPHPPARGRAPRPA